jgi:hypothetical protein
MAINENVIRRISERRIFLIAAILFPLIVLVGFARTYYLKEFFGTPPLATMLVHLHGAVMTAWVALFVTQVWLIRSKNIKRHRTLGFVGVGLAVLIVAIGLTVAINQAARGVTPVPDVPPLAFLVIPAFDILVFAILFAGAVYYRKRPAEHKRLMLLTAINFLPPAVARIPIESLTAFGPLWFFGFPDVIALVCLGYDTWRNGKLNKVFLAGTLIIIASQPLRLMLSGTDAWTRFATWLTT